MTEAAKGADVDTGTVEGIAGTSFKTPEELAAGYLSLEKKLGEQGSELGNIRKERDTLSGHAETLASLLKENLTKGKTPEKAEVTTDYGKEMASAKAELKKLDPTDDDYVERQADLVDKIANLAAAAQHEKTLGAAGKMFKDELSERDVKAAQQRFFDDNPTFNTPEMQARIKEYVSKDRTGMSDPLAAFREIQRDDAAAEAKRLADENAELLKRVNLAKGTDSTGKVIVKGQSPGQSKTNQPKLTGKDLDAGALNALRASRGEA
ncbi:MAG: hypothetical protein WAZ60_24045 [Desulfosalsimonadaceae bacterium]